MSWGGVVSLFITTKDSQEDSLLGGYANSPHETLISSVVVLFLLGFKVHTRSWYSSRLSLATAIEQLPRGDKLGMFTSHWPTERIACMGAKSNPPPQPPSAACLHQSATCSLQGLVTYSTKWP